MMWPGRDEPLFEQHFNGERVRFLWRQDGGMHTVKAEWIRGENPWDVEVFEEKDTVRHLAVERLIHRIESHIQATKPAA